MGRKLLYVSVHRKKIHSNEWDELPIDDDVIHPVEQLSATEKQVSLSGMYPMFEWLPGFYW